MITGPQIRAARALLGWSVAELAERARLSKSSIQRAEGVPGVANIRADNLFRIQQALQEGGVIFLGEEELRRGGIGVRLAR